jgi:hypothetical protein
MPSFTHFIIKKLFGTLFLLDEVGYAIDKSQISEKYANYFLEAFTCVGHKNQKVKVKIALLG